MSEYATKHRNLEHTEETITWEIFKAFTDIDTKGLK